MAPAVAFAKLQKQQHQRFPLILLAKAPLTVVVR